MLPISPASRPMDPSPECRGTTFSKTMDIRDLVGKLQESENVSSEVGLAERDKIYKSVGGVMFAQEYFEIKDNIDKRVAFLKKEIEAASRTASTKTN